MRDACGSRAQSAYPAGRGGGNPSQIRYEFDPHSRFKRDHGSWAVNEGVIARHARRMRVWCSQRFARSVWSAYVSAFPLAFVREYNTNGSVVVGPVI